MTFAIGYRTLKYININSMEVCTRKFGAMQQMPALNTVDCHVDRSVRRRPRSGLQRDLNQKQVICPEPRRVAVVSPADEMYKSCCRLQSNSMVKDEGEPCHEILDIFLRKNGYGDQAIANGSRPFFCGSPPVRADNPLVHDVKFVKKDVPSPPVNLSQKSSCGASFGTKPSVRIEGFACSNSEKHCIVPALA